MATQDARWRVTAVFGALGGVGAWTLQLWLAYLLADGPCREGATGSVLGVPVALAWYGLSLAAGLIAAAAVLAAAVVWRRAPVEGGRSVLRFLGLVGVALSSLFLLTIVLGATAPAFVACR